MKENKLDSASKYFELSIKEYPNSWEAYYCFALCQYKMKNYPKSMNLLNLGKKFSKEKRIIDKFDNAISVVINRMNNQL